MGTFLSSPQGDILTESRHCRENKLPAAQKSATIPATGKRMRFSILMIGGLGVVLFLTSACRPTASPQQLPPPQHTVTIACGAEMLGGLVFLADSRQCYRAAGLQAEVRAFPSGKLAFEALLRGEVPIAACGSIPFALASLSTPDLRVLAVIGSSDNEMKVVARRDHGILNPADLRSRKVATQKASQLHMFLHLFLLKCGLLESDVHLTFDTPEALQKALIAGACDAVAIREPQISPVVSAIGTNAVVFAARGLYVKYYLLVTRAAFLQQEPVTVRAIVRALLKAETLADADPVAAQTTLGQQFQIPPLAMAKLWRDVELHIALPQALVLTLEDEARWALQSGFGTVKELPNFLPMLHLPTLQELNPDEVTVIH